MAFEVEYLYAQSCYFSNFPCMLTMREGICQNCVRSSIFYGSEVWCLKDDETVILKTEVAMIRASCGIKLIDKWNNQDYRYEET